MEEKKKRFVPDFIEQARATGKGRIRIIEILLFLAVFFATTAAQGTVSGILMVVTAVPKIIAEGAYHSVAEMESMLMSDTAVMLLSISATEW